MSQRYLGQCLGRHVIMCFWLFSGPVSQATPNQMMSVGYTDRRVTGPPQRVAAILYVLEVAVSVS